MSAIATNEQDIIEETKKELAEKFKLQLSSSFDSLIKRLAGKTLQKNKKPTNTINKFFDTSSFLKEILPKKINSAKNNLLLKNDFSDVKLPFNRVTLPSKQQKNNTIDVASVPKSINVLTKKQNDKTIFPEVLSTPSSLPLKNEAFLGKTLENAQKSIDFQKNIQEIPVYSQPKVNFPKTVPKNITTIANEVASPMSPELASAKDSILQKKGIIPNGFKKLQKIIDFNLKDQKIDDFEFNLKQNSNKNSTLGNSKNNFLKKISNKLNVSDETEQTSSRLFDKKLNSILSVFKKRNNSEKKTNTQNIISSNANESVEFSKPLKNFTKPNSLLASNFSENKEPIAIPKTQQNNVESKQDNSKAINLVNVLLKPLLDVFKPFQTLLASSKPNKTNNIPFVSSSVKPFVNNNVINKQANLDETTVATQRSSSLVSAPLPQKGLQLVNQPSTLETAKEKPEVVKEQIKEVEKPVKAVTQPSTLETVKEKPEAVKEKPEVVKEQIKEVVKEQIKEVVKEKPEVVKEKPETIKAVTQPSTLETVKEKPETVKEKPEAVKEKPETIKAVTQLSTLETVKEKPEVVKEQIKEVVKEKPEVVKEKPETVKAVTQPSTLEAVKEKPEVVKEQIKEVEKPTSNKTELPIVKQPEKTKLIQETQKLKELTRNNNSVFSIIDKQLPSEKQPSLNKEFPLAGLLNGLVKFLKPSVQTTNVQTKKDKDPFIEAISNVAANQKKSELEDIKEPTPFLFAGFTDKGFSDMKEKLPDILKPLLEKLSFSVPENQQEKDSGIGGIGPDILKGGLRMLAGVGGLLVSLHGMFTSEWYKGLEKIIGKGLMDFSGFTKLADKFIGKFVSKLIKIPTRIISGFGKSIMGMFGKEAGKAALKTGLGASKSFIPKLLGGVLKFIKKVPFVGSLITIGYAWDRFNKGDYVGGGLEVLSGVANAFGLTPLSWAIDGLNAFLDYKAGGIGEGKKGKGEMITDWIKSFGTWAKEKIMGLPVLGSLIRATTDFLGNPLESLKNLALAIPGVQSVVSFFDNPLENTKQALKTTGNWIAKFGSWAWEKIQELPILGSIIKGVKNLFSGNIMEGLHDLAKATPIGFLIDLLAHTETGMAIGEKTKGIVGSMGSFLGNIKDKVLRKMLEFLPETILGISVRSRVADMLGINMGPVNDEPSASIQPAQTDKNPTSTAKQAPRTRGEAAAARDQQTSVTPVADAKIDPSGGLLVSSPKEGALYQLSKNDSIIAAPKQQNANPQLETAKASTGKMESILEKIASNTGATNSNIANLIVGFNSMAKALKTVGEAVGEKINISPVVVQQAQEKPTIRATEYAKMGNSEISDVRNLFETLRPQPT